MHSQAHNQQQQSTLKSQGTEHIPIGLSNAIEKNDQPLIIWAPPGYLKGHRASQAIDQAQYLLLKLDYTQTELTQRGASWLVDQIKARLDNQPANRRLALLCAEAFNFEQPALDRLQLMSLYHQFNELLSPMITIKRAWPKLERVVVTTSLCPADLTALRANPEAPDPPWQLLNARDLGIEVQTKIATRTWRTGKTLNPPDPQWQTLASFCDGWPSLYQIVQRHMPITHVNTTPSTSPARAHQALLHYWHTLKQAWLTHEERELASYLSLMGSEIPLDFADMIIHKRPEFSPSTLDTLITKSVLSRTPSTFTTTDDCSEALRFTNNALVDLLQTDCKAHMQLGSTNEPLIRWTHEQLKQLNNPLMRLEFNLNLANWEQAVNDASSFTSMRHQSGQQQAGQAALRSDFRYRALLKRLPLQIQQHNPKLKKLLSFETLLLKMKGSTSRANTPPAPSKKAEQTSATTAQHHLNPSKLIYVNAPSKTEHDINFGHLKAARQDSAAGALIDINNYILAHDINPLGETALRIIDSSRGLTVDRLPDASAINQLQTAILGLFYAHWQSGDFSAYYDQLQALTACSDTLDPKLSTLLHLSQLILQLEAQAPAAITIDPLEGCTLHPQHFDFCTHALLARCYIKQSNLKAAYTHAQLAQDQRFFEATLRHTQLFPNVALEFDLLFKAGQVSEGLSVMKRFERQDISTLAPRLRSQLAFYQFLRSGADNAFESERLLFAKKGLNMSLGYHLCLKALAHFMSQKNKRILKHLENALNVIEPYPYRSLLFDFGPSMSYLLLYAREKGFKHRILDALMPQVQHQVYQGVICPKLLTLSKREIEVLSLINSGYSNEDISNRICRSIGTVKLHVHSIYKKLDINTRVQAIKKCQKQGFFGLYLK